MATTGLNDVDDIPRAWRSALASIQTLAPEAVIAGGCLRDREHGVKVKDIDIFVPCESVDSHEGKVFEQKMKNDGWHNVQTLHDESYNGSRISRSIETEFPNCPPINIIVMPYSLIEFDFGICQIEFNGKRIFRTRDYVIDHGARQFRLVPKIGDAEFIRTIDRWSRLKEKYPGWKFNLGSRSETTIVLGQANLPGVISQSQAMTQARSRQFMPMRPYNSDLATLADLMSKGPAEYVLPRHVAERLSKETTAKVVGQRPDGKIVVHIDNSAVTSAAAILKEMVSVRNQLMKDQARKAADHP